MSTISYDQLNVFYDLSGEWMFYLSMALLGLEGLRLLLGRGWTWRLVGDTVSNFIVYGVFILITYVLIFTLYVGGFYAISEYFALADIPTNWWTFALCLLLADFAYYWEHRFSHRTAIGWSTHSVHHSSPYFNLSVAYRFGPMDGIIPFLFNAPLVVMGFDPMLVLLCESLVLLYQTPIHTELVGRMPKWVEAIFNTPSHHRVHHGANLQYHDRNYAGILIIWDRMFGTFAEEREKVVYGLTRQIDSVNPVVIFLHGLYRLGRKIIDTPGLSDKFKLLLMPPAWEPEKAGQPQATASGGRR